MSSTDGAPLDTGIEESNPNAAGPQGLRGDMGISSERTGPLEGATPETADGGVQGTGSRGTAAKSTEGTMDTTSNQGGAQHAQEPAEGPEMDDNQQEAAQNWRDTQTAAGSTDDDDEDEPSVDRTVGESNTAEVPSHDSDPERNPGHSHG